MTLFFPNIATTAFLNLKSLLDLFNVVDSRLTYTLLQYSINLIIDGVQLLGTNLRNYEAEFRAAAVGLCCQHDAQTPCPTKNNSHF